MPNTFAQLYIQIVFSVKGRQNIITNKWSDEIHKYISSIITEKGNKSIIVNGARDHIHVFLGLKPTQAISDIVRDIKSSSANFINKKRFVQGKFKWQEGYGAFSYSHSQIDQVYKYIENQEEHHKIKTFKDRIFRVFRKI